MAWYEVPLRLGLSTLFGLIIGIERERHHRPAGIKTHIMVCMGAALVSLIQLEIVDDVVRRVAADPALADVLKADYGRLGAQVVSGIGFLGAGTILRTKGSVKGLTTASTLWIIACVGLAVGMGYYYISIVTVGFIAVVLTAMRFIQNAMQNSKGIKRINIVMQNKRTAMNFVNDYCVSQNIEIRNVELLETPVSEAEYDSVEEQVFTFSYDISIPRTKILKNVIMELQMEDSILSVSQLSDDVAG